MCGIAGFVDHSGKLKLPLILDKTLELMRFRGPDGVGSYINGNHAIGMRRLSIVDHSKGKQPKSSSNGQVQVVQNGEIYNFKSLRHELIRRGYYFTSNSDTEVLAHGYEEWGIEVLLDKIDGMFAFAIIDEGRNTLHLARDRFGEKPLYFHYRDKVFGFASNMKALMLSLSLPKTIDPISLNRYFALHYVPGDRTIFSEVERLLPGERMQVSLVDGTFFRSRYFQMLEKEEDTVDPIELQSLMNHSVESRLIGDVPVGVFLSGGLDSSLVTTLAAKKMPQIKTFSIGFDSFAFDESTHASSLANACNIDHELIQFSEKDFCQLLPEIASVLDEPLGDQAALPTYKLCKTAAEHVKIVLSGEGADEFFGGYSYYEAFAQREFFLKKLFRKSSLPKVATLIDDSSAISPSGFPLIMNREVRNSIITQSNSESNDQWEASLVSYLNTFKDPLKRACATDALTWLPDNLLVKLDRMTMSVSLEGRCPFLEKNLAEYAFNLPICQKRLGSESKVMLRSMARNYFPEINWQRKKQGFILPMAIWLKNYIHSRGGTENFVNERNCDYLDCGAVIKLMDKLALGSPGAERALYALVMFLEWTYSFFRY